MPDLTTRAIKAALNEEWEEAISLNQEILKEKENDINALCRLAYAFCQGGNLGMAKKFYGKVLSLDRYNVIAQKNLEKIKFLPKNFKRQVGEKKTVFSPSVFIEEPGKTKTVTLVNPAPRHVLSLLEIGKEVILLPKKHSIEIRKADKVYLGALPDDVTFRLLRFLKAGNRYQVFIKNATRGGISVFLREVKRGKRFEDQPTFITSKTQPKPGKEISLEEEDQSSQESQEEE